MLCKFEALRRYAARTLVAVVRPASTVPLPVLKVPSSQVEMTRSSLNALITQLEEDIPRSLSTIGALKFALDGHLLCKVHTNGWPSFNSMVCEVIYPRASEVADLLCYSRGSEEDLLQLILSNNLISWGRRQLIYYLESKFSDYLTDNLLDPSTGLKVLTPSEEYLSAHYPKGLNIKEIPCPAGLVLGRLSPHHAPLLTKHWGNSRGWAASIGYTTSIISELETRAVYPVSDLDTPVAWILQNSAGRPSSVYIIEEYRGKKIGTLLTAEMLRALVSNGLVTETLFELDSTFRNIPSKLGGILSDYTLKWLLLEQ